MDRGIVERVFINSISIGRALTGKVAPHRLSECAPVHFNHIFALSLYYPLQDLEAGLIMREPHLKLPAGGRRDYFGALDGFRGALALLIAVYHTIWLTHINSSDFLNNGQVLVDLFLSFPGF